ncbi:MAG: hypothetical protein KF878_13010 [Planctomycetes bacterium]|nr:hypothetical protein [Planctomycetota bacterium]
MRVTMSRDARRGDEDDEGLRRTRAVRRFVPDDGADQDPFAPLRDAVDELLALQTVPAQGHGSALLDRLPPDVATRLVQLVFHSAALAWEEGFATQTEFDAYVEAAPWLEEAELLRGLSRMPRDILENVAAFFARAVAERDDELEVLRRRSPATPPPAEPPTEPPALPRRAAEALARRDRLLEARTARIDELLRRLSDLERDREAALALLRRLDDEMRRLPGASAPVAGGPM